ncbi:IPT1 [Candida pseudojiufengensis]|uniref:IPT1 n=1 Tax=Candida pseudojiufengensis TaxID=497109 RepID=UPI00222456B2|nr:IPT1 [Candida pseudojiufengensis]KAI5964579.1 IPT1 [Candida pseudojiufengensis]
MIKDILLNIIKPIIFLYQFFHRIFYSGLNQRSIWGLCLNFFINFSPIFIWLLIFKNAGLIPHEIRPKIHVSLPFYVDQYMFHSLIGSLLTIILLIPISILIYIGIFKFKNSNLQLFEEKIEYIPTSCNTNQLQDEGEEEKYNISSTSTSSSSSSSSSSNSSSFDIEMGLLDQYSTDEEEQEKESTITNQEENKINNYLSTIKLSTTKNFQDSAYFKDITFFKTLSTQQINQMALKINKKILKKNLKIPSKAWVMAPSFLILSSWFILNFDYWLKDPIRTWKDLLAWTSYVLGHITVPIITSVYLYVFHAPGVLKSYSIALGLQNICGVLTHLLFPCSPPWFIHLYGLNSEANYEMPGYAAGLIRVDVTLGTHLNSKGFHASPIVFGAIPSLHSAMACMTFYFISFYSNFLILKILALGFVILQWWATIYLDHHWRLDLFIGLIYSTIWFSIIYKFMLIKYNKKFLESRLNFKFENGGSTMGMRVFRNTCIQWFFDPLY